LNRRLCLGNKIFTYLAAGVPVLLSATPAQVVLGQDLGKASVMYESGDVAGLAEKLACLASDPGARVQARKAARQAAQRRWHWEHPEDRGALIDVVRRALPDARS
jgi:glycosyltransferase involved in cell wall biosynthesis